MRGRTNTNVAATTAIACATPKSRRRGDLGGREPLGIVPVGREGAPELTLDDLFVDTASDAVLVGEKAFSLGMLSFLCNPVLVPLDGLGIFPGAEPLEPIADAHHSTLLDRGSSAPAVNQMPSRGL